MCQIREFFVVLYNISMILRNSLTDCFTDLIKWINHKNSPNSGINSLHPFYEYPYIGIIFNNLLISSSQFTFYPLVR